MLTPARSVRGRAHRGILLLLLVGCPSEAPSLKDSPPTDDSAPPTDTDLPPGSIPGACDADAAAQIVGAEYEGAGNRVVFVDDLDGDGGEDLAIGSYYGTRTCVVSGALSGGASVDEALVCYEQVSEYEFAGTAIDLAGDLDGDGAPDLLIGAIGNDDNGQYAGAIYVISGPTASGPSSLGVARTTLLGELSGDYAGQGVAAAGDVNGDGLQDALVGADGNDLGGNGGGKAYLLYGPLEAGVRLLADEGTTFVGTGPVGLQGPPPPHGAPASGDGAGRAIDAGADFDGDGLADLALGLNGNDLGGADAGAVAVFFGPIEAGEHAAVDAPVLYLGSADHPLLGDEVAFVGDLDRDGRADLITTSNMDDAGTVWVLPGHGTAGQIPVSDAYARLTGPSAGEQAGYGMAGGGDFDGDGEPDLAIGAPFQDEVAADAGRIYLVRGPFTPGATALSTEQVWTGVEEMDYAGRSVAMGDGDGDGLADVAWGSYFNDAAGYFAGSACVGRGR